MAKLRVHNIESGPASSDVAFGISGDTIAVSSDSIQNNVWKDSGGNTLFQSDGSGTMSNVNAGLTGGGPQLISSQTASGAASVSFTTGIDSTYDLYMFVCLDCNPATDTPTFTFQAGSGYNTTMTTTAYRCWKFESGDSDMNFDTGAAQAQGTNYQQLCEDVGNGADECCAGEIFLFNPSSTTYLKSFYSTFNSYQYEDRSYNHYVAGYFNTTSAITQVQFKFSSGNFDGKIKMYGVS